jgi:hypothetical protein
LVSVSFKVFNFGGGGVAQTIQCLLCKHKALSSSPSPTKKKKERVDSFINSSLFGEDAQ